MTEPTRIRARLEGDVVDVKILMSHDMETGLRVDASGAPIAAHFISNVIARHGGRIVLSAQFGIAVSRNPLLEFRFRGGARGDSISVTWVDNLGETRTDSASVT